MNAEQLLEILNANKLMHSDEEAMAFEEAMTELAKTPQNEYLRPLHLVFDDECKHYEVMYGLVHFVESFEQREQLQAFIDVAPKILDRAVDWTKRLLYGILNDDSARVLYSQLLRSASVQSREVACNLLQEIINDESSPLSERAAFVLEGLTAGKPTL
jgi:Immunity protein 30